MGKSEIEYWCSGELVDYNVGTFKESKTNIGDDIWAIVPSLAFRPTGTTVIRFNYRFEGSHEPIKQSTQQNQYDTIRLQQLFLNRRQVVYK